MNNVNVVSVEKHLKCYDRASTNVEEHLKIVQSGFNLVEQRPVFIKKIFIFLIIFIILFIFFNCNGGVVNGKPSLSPPTELEAVFSGDVFSLHWKDNAVGEDGYYIEKKKTSESSFKVIATLDYNTVHYSDGQIQENNSYQYRVQAFNYHTQSSYSNQVEIAFPLIGLCYEKGIGGTANDYGHSIHGTLDNGFVVAGTTFSSDGDISGKNGSSDVLIAKFNADYEIEWQKCLGGIFADIGYCIQQTNDEGYIITGITTSIDIPEYDNGEDILVIKLDSNGNVEWQKCFGGSSRDRAYCIKQTSDLGYILTGDTGSNNYGCDVTLPDPPLNNYNAWVLKLSPDGIKEWDKSVGSDSIDCGYSIDQTFDSGYIMAGSIYTLDKKSEFVIVRFDIDGDVLWQKTYGGASDEIAYSVQQSSDSGFIVVGNTSSSDGDVTGWKGSEDIWVVKIDDSGDLLWNKCLGGTQNDNCNLIQRVSGNGYIIIGHTFSNTMDVSGNNGESDLWLVKLNNQGDIQWQRCFGGEDEDKGRAIHQLSDFEFIATGYTHSNILENKGENDLCIIKYCFEDVNFDFIRNDEIINKE